MARVVTLETSVNLLIAVKLMGQMPEGQGVVLEVSTSEGVAAMAGVAT